MKIGQMQQAKGGGYYIKLGEGINPKNVELNNLIGQLKEIVGDVLYLEKPADYIDGLVGAGFISADEAATRKSKLPEFIKFNVNVDKKNVKVG